jgi:hypothetical protein
MELMAGMAILSLLVIGLVLFLEVAARLEND